MSLTFAGWVKIRFPLVFFPLKFTNVDEEEETPIDSWRKRRARLKQFWFLSFVSRPLFCMLLGNCHTSMKHLWYPGSNFLPRIGPYTGLAWKKHKDVVIYFKEKRVFIICKHCCRRYFKEKMRQKKSYRLELAALSLSKNVGTSHQ